MKVSILLTTRQCRSNRKMQSITPIKFVNHPFVKFKFDWIFIGFCRVNWSQLELFAPPGILVKLSTWDRIYGRTLNLDHKTCKRWELLDAEVHVNEKWSAISASNSSNASQWINNNAETNMQPQQIAWTVDKPPPPPPPRRPLGPRQCQILAKYFELVTL